MKSLLAIAPIFLFAACAATLPAPNQPSGPTLPAPNQPSGPTLPALADDSCNANRYRELIGQDVTALERILLLGQVRIIRPGQPVTADLRPERINFNIGPDERIGSISCS